MSKVQLIFAVHDNKTETNMDKLEFYELPFSYINGCGFIYDKNGNFAFQFEMFEEEMWKSILDVINNGSMHANGGYTAVDDCVVDDRGYSIITARGWGNLTGLGGHGMSSEDAAKIQDNLIEWICNRLNSSTEIASKLKNTKIHLSCCECRSRFMKECYRNGAKLGFDDGGGRNRVLINIPFMFIDSQLNIYVSDDPEYFNEHEYKQIFFEDVVKGK